LWASQSTWEKSLVAEHWTGFFLTLYSIML
jgi:hypothetical protein